MLMKMRRLGELERPLNQRGDAHIIFTRWSRRRRSNRILLRGGWNEGEDAGLAAGGVDDLWDHVFFGHLVIGAVRAGARLPRTLAAEDEATTDRKGEFAQIIILKEAFARDVSGYGWRC